MHAKKSLGQHFLRSESALQTIIEAARVTKKDIVLEIGPGEGILTERLLKRAKKVVAVEKDDRLIPFLKERFEEDIEKGNLTLIHKDILEVNLKKKGFKDREFKVVANIPYYITGILIRTLLSGETQPESMVLLVQKEVAERIAREKKESLLSLSVKIFGNPVYVKTVKKGSFSPPPKVDSAILAIEHISKKRLNNKEKEDFFFELLHAGFGQKRKTLLKNLSPLVEKEKIEQIFEKLKLKITSRAEDLSISSWVALSESLFPHKAKKK